MDQPQIQGNLQFVDRILNRLLEHYLTREALPGTDEERLTVTLFHRLARCVVAEGYGA